MGFYRSWVPDEYRLSGSRKHRKWSPIWIDGRIQSKSHERLNYIHVNNQINNLKCLVDLGSSGSSHHRSATSKIICKTRGCRWQAHGRDRLRLLQPCSQMDFVDHGGNCHHRIWYAGSHRDSYCSLSPFRQEVSSFSLGNGTSDIFQNPTLGRSSDHNRRYFHLLVPRQVRNQEVRVILLFPDLSHGCNFWIWVCPIDSSRIWNSKRNILPLVSGLRYGSSKWIATPPLTDFAFLLLFQLLISWYCSPC